MIYSIFYRIEFTFTIGTDGHIETSRMGFGRRHNTSVLQKIHARRRERHSSVEIDRPSAPLSRRHQFEASRRVEKHPDRNLPDFASRRRMEEALCEIRHSQIRPERPRNIHTVWE